MLALLFSGLLGGLLLLLVLLLSEYLGLFLRLLLRLLFTLSFGLSLCLRERQSLGFLFLRLLLGCLLFSTLLGLESGLLFLELFLLGSELALLLFFGDARLHLLLGLQLGRLLLLKCLLLGLESGTTLLSLSLGLLSSLLLLELLFRCRLDHLKFVSLGLRIHFGLVKHLDFGTGRFGQVLRRLGLRKHLFGALRLSRTSCRLSSRLRVQLAQDLGLSRSGGPLLSLMLTLDERRREGHVTRLGALGWH